MYNKAVYNNLFIRIKLLISMAMVALLGTACSAEVTLPDTPTPTQVIIITATLPPTQTLPASPTLEPTAVTATPIPVVIEGQTTLQLNVRNAPSADGEQIGILSPSTTVQIAGKDPTSGWWMIVYPESPSGIGWVASQYVQVADPWGVPVISTQVQTTGNAPVTGNTPEAGANPTVEVGSEAVPSPVPEPILATAFPDGDSAQSPSVSMKLASNAMRSFNFSSDVSSPEGDPEDWVQFALEGQSGQQMMVSVVLECAGSGALNVELIQNSVLLQGWDNLSCDQQRSQLQLYLFAGAPYNLRLFPAQNNNSLTYAAYTLTVQLFK